MTSELNRGDYVVLSAKGDEQVWAFLPTLETAIQSCAYWRGMGWYSWIRRCGPSIEWETE